MNLTSIPAFGYQTSTCNAKVNVYKSLHQLWEKEANENMRNHNIGKLIGYIPIIGTIAGAVRIKMSGEHKNKYHHIIRGSIELLSLGFLLLIPDLILTAYRTQKAKKSLIINGDSFNV